MPSRVVVSVRGVLAPVRHYSTTSIVGGRKTSKIPTASHQPERRPVPADAPATHTPSNVSRSTGTGRHGQAYAGGFAVASVHLFAPHGNAEEQTRLASSAPLRMRRTTGSDGRGRGDDGAGIGEHIHRFMSGSTHRAESTRPRSFASAPPQNQSPPMSPDAQPRQETHHQAPLSGEDDANEAETSVLFSQKDAALSPSPPPPFRRTSVSKREKTATHKTASATASLLRTLKKDRPRTAVASSVTSSAAAPRTAKVSNGSAPPSTPPKHVSQSFLHHLRASVETKRLDWGAMCAAHPELFNMPLYVEHDDWTNRYGMHHAAVPLDDGDATDANARTAPELPVFVCTAPTGAGKSVLVSFCFLDAHWRAVAQKVVSALDRAKARDLSMAHQNGDDEQDAANKSTARSVVEVDSDAALPLDDLALFARRLKSSSRVCVVVSQPTRLACVELATYTAALLSHDSGACTEKKDSVSRAASSGVGGRVGYAVGGEACFSAQTEIVYATPGYILNALQHQDEGVTRTAAMSETSAASSSSSPPPPSQTPLRPTTLIVDEAHCRDVETDLLLAWVRLQRADHNRASPPRLRQVVVMSATLNAAAMLRYFQGRSLPIWILTTAQRATVAAAAVASTPEPGAPVASLFSTEADASPHLDHRVLITATRAAATVTGPYPVERYFVDDLTESPPHARRDSAGRGGLQNSALLFPWKPHAASHSPPLSTSSSSHRGRGRRQASSDRRRGDTSHPSAHPSSSATAEQALLLTSDGRALLETLQSTFSTRFFGAKSPASGHHASHQLQQPQVRDAAGHTQPSVQLYGPQAARIAELVLELFQALRLARVHADTSTSTQNRTGAAAHPTAADAHAPDTILLFLPGFAEIQLVLQSLERRCARSLRAVHLSPADPTDNSHDEKNADGARSAAARLAPSASSPSTSASEEPITVLEHGKECFSVPVLHASAVGSPQMWLRLTGDTRTAPSQRLVLATTLAESSLTIPGVRVVVDACLERQFVADPITGTTRKLTTLATAGSLQQRCGRAGRTGPGVVIHLAPRALFDHAEGGPALSPSGTRGDGSLAEASPLREAGFEPLRESPATLLLCVKSLFTAPSSTKGAVVGRGGMHRHGFQPSVSDVLAALPSPPSALALEAAYQQLIDMDLLLPPSSVGSAPASAALSLPDRLNCSTLSPKGRLVVLLPIPMESALLIYHAFAFDCVEEAVLVGCAMTVPSLFTTPRLVTDASSVRQQNTPAFLLPGVAAGVRQDVDDERDGEYGSTHTKSARAIEDITLSPLAQYSQHLAVQRQLAGLAGDDIADETDAVPAATASTRADAEAELSEPLVWRALLREWYACPSSVHLMQLHNKYHLNRSAMRSVDVAIAQCCQRLLQCLAKADEARLAPSPHALRQAHSPTLGRRADRQRGSHDKRTSTLIAVETEEDAHDYFVLSESSAPSAGLPTAAAPSPTLTGRSLPYLIDPLWPPQYRERLVHSLYRLRQAALARATHRLSSAHSPREALPQWYGADRELGLLMARVFRGGANGENVASDDTSMRGGLTPAVPLHPSLAYGAHAALASCASSSSPSSSAARSLAESLPACSRRAALLEAQRDPARSTLSFGTAEARLRAAYVAAFARHTLSGSDGGYRRHHRRLVRNLNTLTTSARSADVSAVSATTTDAMQAVALPPKTQPEAVEAEMDIASFRVDVRAVSVSSHTTPLAARMDRASDTEVRPTLTPAPLLSALQGLLGRARVAHVDLFRDQRTAVVRFTRVKSAAAAASTPTSSSSSPSPGAMTSSGSRRVRLGPFGYSLLVAAQSVLQRLPIELPVPARAAVVAEATDTDSGGGAGRMVRDGQTSSDPPRRARSASSASAVHFEQTRTQELEDVHVRWHTHAFGTTHVVRRSDAERLGFGEWFPTPPPPTTTTRTTAAPSSHTPPASVSSTSTSPLSSDLVKQSTSNAVVSEATQAAVWSVLSPLNVTRGIYWKAGLPSTTAWWRWHVQSSQKGPQHDAEAQCVVDDRRSGQAFSAATGRDDGVRYCPLCHVACANEAQQASHCRGLGHLQHLHFAVRHGMRVEQVRRVIGMAPTPTQHDRPEERDVTRRRAPREEHTPLHSALFLTASSSSSAVTSAALLPLEFHPCRLSPLSFLNALQWRSDSRTPPIAVAGALISSSTFSSSAAAVAESTMLTAHHVWVLPPVVDTRSSEDARAQKDTAAPPPAVLSPNALLTLAGFITASTRRAPAVFLFDASHAFVYAVLLTGRGIWSFEAQPLPVRELGALTYMMHGGAWPGVMRLTEEAHARWSPVTPTRTDAQTPTREGLHWCVPDPSAPCPHCTYYQPQTDEAATVVAVLLLVLHEYRQAERRMVTLADYVERVVAKLDMSAPTASSGHGSARLATFFRARQEEKDKDGERPHALKVSAFADRERISPRATSSLAGEDIVAVLRSIGCQFALPPHALTAADTAHALASSGLEDAETRAMTETNTVEAPRVDRATRPALSPLALAVQGASLEVQFTVPAVLPTHLPSIALETRTQRFYEERGGAAMGVRRVEPLARLSGYAGSAARRASATASSPPPLPPPHLF